MCVFVSVHTHVLLPPPPNKKQVLSEPGKVIIKCLEQNGSNCSGPTEKKRLSGMYVIFYMLELSHRMHIPQALGELPEVGWHFTKLFPGRKTCHFSFPKHRVLTLSKDRRQEWVLCVYMCIHVYLPESIQKKILSFAFFFFFFN